MPKEQPPSLWISAAAGGLAGAVITLLLLQNPGITGQANPLETSAPLTREGSEAISYEQAVIETVESVSPAVISIVITQDVPVLEQYFEEMPGTWGPFDDFFGRSPFHFQVPRLRERGTERREIGGGSGFLISSDGMIVTNKHVVSREDAEYTVFLNDGSRHNAEVIARDPVNDIAILQISGRDLPFLEFGNSDALQVGQTAIAIGNALGEFKNTVSVGVISGLSRSIIAGSARGQSEQLDEVIQTDAAINPGNSGGPLLDLSGRVVGVNVAVALASENIGFALPANTVKAAVDSVRETGVISRPYIGVRYAPVTPAIQEANELPVDYGALVIRGERDQEPAVFPGSPAEQADIREGDIILEADGRTLDEDYSLAQAVRRKEIGDTMTLKILRDGEEREVEIVLEEFPQ